MFSVKTIIAIDPGANGAVIIRNEDILRVNKLPRDENEKMKLFSFIKDTYEKPLVFLEMVQMFLSDSDKNMNPGKQFRIKIMLEENQSTKTILKIIGVPYIEVAPISWQSRLNIRIPGEDYNVRKKRFKGLAQKAFNHRNIKVTAWSADALLISEFADLILQQDPSWVMERVPNFLIKKLL